MSASRSELDAAIERLSPGKHGDPLLSEDGDWLGDEPDSAQFQADLRLVLAAASLEALLAERDARTEELWQQDEQIMRIVAERDALAAQLTASQAVIAAAKALPDRREVVPIDETVRRHAFIKGSEDAMDRVRDILSADPDQLLRERDAKVWHEGVRAAFSRSIEDGNWTPADLTNPYRERANND